MFKIFLLTVLLLFNCLSIGFTEKKHEEPLSFWTASFPWVFVESNNGVDTFVRTVTYEQHGQSYRVPPMEFGDVAVIYDYPSQEKAVLTKMKLNYLKNTYSEVGPREVYKYKNFKKKLIATEPVNNTEIAIPAGSAIEKIRNAARLHGQKKLRSFCGTYMVRTSDDIITNGVDIRLIQLDDGRIQVLYFPGDSEVLKGYMDGKTNYCSFIYRLETLPPDKLVDTGRCFVYTSMYDANIDRYYSDRPQYDIYSFSIKFNDAKASYELERTKEGTKPGQRDYSNGGNVSWVGNS